MADEPFIGGESRPDLTVDMDAKVGDMTVRQLADILGRSAPQKAKEVQEKQVFEKQIIKEQVKEHPDKIPVKEHKDSKDNADNKATKDHKEAADTKANKDHKEAGDTKNAKDSKDNKEHKDHIKEIQKDHKDTIKDNIKDHIKELVLEKNQVIEQKALASEVLKGEKELVEGNVPTNPGDPAQGIDQLIQRVTGLEQQVAALQQAAAPQGG